MDARRLILGDWGRVIRDPMDLWRAGLAVAAVAYAAGGELGGAGYLAVSAAVTTGVRLVDAPRALDLAVLIAMSLTGFGEALGFYDRYDWFDNLVHFVVPMLLAPSIYIGLARVEVVPDPKAQTGLQHRPSLWILTFALGMAVGGVWEILEWASDGTVGSNLSEGNDDTVGDLISDCLGALAGGGLLVLWTMRGWGSVRRIPGDNRAEDTSA